ncbi:MAG: hypothetical protein Fur0037_16470 [Planctomycetota bacterium]
MTSTASLEARAPAGKATALGSAIAAAAGALLWAIGPLPSDLGCYLGMGILAALLTEAVVFSLVKAILRVRSGGDPSATGQRLQILMGSGFAVRLLVLAAGVFGLRQAGLKFESIATFALAFAGAALICQVCSAAILARALGRASPGTKNHD